MWCSRCGGEKREGNGDVGAELSDETGDHPILVSAPGPRGTALVFLPGLTADHRLFQMQFSFLHPTGPCWCGTHRATGPPAHLPWISP